MKKIIVYSAVLIGMAITAQAQNVGIGTTLPKARLHVADSSVLFSGPASLPGNAGLPPVSGAGNRLMWYANKAAFRAGGTTGTLWDEASVGNYSTAFGLANRASGLYTLSSGWANSSSGIGSFTSGHSTSATGNYSVALGEQTDAASYGSLVIGRYNLTAGSGTAWVDADPLFVVGNGFTYETSPGVVAIQRRNAFEILKNGDASLSGSVSIGKNLSLAERLYVSGVANFASSLSVDGVLAAHNSAVFSKSVSISGQLAVDTINSVKVINTNYPTGTMSELNLVPLGVVKFTATYNRNGFDECNRSVTNLTGNFISGSIVFCDDPTGQDSKVGISLLFNTAQAALYNDIIAAPNVFYDGMGIILGPSGAELTGCGSKVVYDTDNKPAGFYAGFNTEDIPTTGVYTVSGTVMFYGIK
ncbi:MAG: hypothetical protein IPP72_10420 [Chitinophagaceae bacterium]|nr:hypothetical protein [Chitinophagaceae bacterium]